MDSTGGFARRASAIPAKAKGLPRDERNTGPDTLSRYDYQAKCVALTIIDHMLTGELSAVLVEHSTDLILVPAQGLPTLVSIKHRDPGQVDGDGWRMSALKKQRVLQALHDAWVAADKQCMVSFWSNAGLTGDAALLRAACVFGDDGERDEDAAQRVLPVLARHLGVPPAQAREFLAALLLQRPDQVLPRRNEIDDVGVRRAQILLTQSGRDGIHAERCWNWLLREHVEPVSRSSAQSAAVRTATLGAALLAVARRRAETEFAFRFLPVEQLRAGLLREADRCEAQRAPAPRAWVADPLFVGREPELERLADLLRPGGVEPVAPVVIHGMTGCGKTSLALRFATAHAQELRTVVVDASTRAGLIAGLEALQPQRDPGHDAGTLADLRTATTLAIPGGSATLLVLDGVADTESIRGLVPRTGLCRVLITSTVAHLDDGFGSVPLAVWHRAETHAYVRQVLTHASQEDYENLARELSDHPLAVCQAVNYCRTVGIGVADYLQRLHAAAASVLEHGEAAGHPASVVQCVRLAVDAVRSRNPHAVALLTMLAYLGAGPVRLDLFDGEVALALADMSVTRTRRRFRRVANVRWHSVGEELVDAREQLRSPVARDAAIMDLAAFSLVTAADGFATVHPLVQMIVREDAADSLAWFQLVLGLFLRALGGEKTLWPVLDAHLSHLAACVAFARARGWDGPSVIVAACCVIARSCELGRENAEVDTGYRLLESLSRRSTREEWVDQACFELRSAMRRTLLYLGRAEEVLILAEQNVAAADRSGLPGVRWRALVELGEIAYETGQRDIAMRTLDELPDPREADPDRSSNLLIAAANARAKLLYVANRMDEAHQVISWAFGQVELMPPGAARSKMTAVLHTTAAEIYEASNDPGASLEHAKRALAEQRAHLDAQGTVDRGYVTTLLTAADSAIDLGDLGAAGEWLAEAERLAVDDLGPGTLGYTMLLAIRGRYRLHLVVPAMLRREPRDIKPAIADLEQAARDLRARRVVIQLPSVLVHLAQALQLDGRGAEALERAHEALDLDIKIYGPDHPQVQTDRTIIDQLGYTVVVF